MLALVALVVGGAGCGEKAPTPAPSGPGGDAGLGGAGGSTPVVPATVWNDSSQSIDVTCSSYWTGSTRFVASRAQMTEEQLALLSKLVVVDSGGPCLADGFACSITIVQGDGTSLSIRSVEDDLTCQQSQPVVSYASFKPFADTWPCPSAQGPLRLSSADDTIAPDARCYQQLLTSGTGDLTRSISLTDVRTALHVELDDCNPGPVGALSFKLLNADGTTLGTSTAPADPGPNHTCAALATLVPLPETATVVVSVSGATQAAAFWLRVYQDDSSGSPGGAPPVDTPIWTDASQSIQVSCSGYYSGAMQLQASRDQLTGDQLALLAGLRTVSMSSSCILDGMSCQVTVRQADGTEQVFAAEEDGWCLPSSQEHVAFSALKPFLDAVACPFIRVGLRQMDAVPLDARCFDAVASGAPGSLFQVFLDDVARPLHVELDECAGAASAGPISFTVFNADGSPVGTSMVPADPGPAHTCAQLLATGPSPGPLTISVSGNVPSGVAPSLRVYQ